MRYTISPTTLDRFALSPRPVADSILGMRLIQRLRFCPGCGQGELKTTSDKSLHCVSCGFLLYINVATAAGGLISDESGRLLLLRRAKEPARGKLGAPGGFIDAGETVEEGLCREIREEVNLTVSSMRYLCSYPNEYTCQGITYLTADLYFACEVESLKSARAMEEVEEILMLHPEEIREEDLAFPSLRQAMKVFAGLPNRAAKSKHQ